VQKISHILHFVRELEEPVDFVLYGGDDVERFEEEDINYLSQISEFTKQKKVLAVIGNDDSLEEKRILRAENVHDLHEKPFVFKDFAFIGLEGSTSRPAIVQYSEEEVKEHIEKQHTQVKGKKLVILSHAPPYSVLDLGIRFAESDEGIHHIGSESLRDFIQQKNVELVLCGHCHSHGGLVIARA
jgi:Icc-related predicted phosphoesterase